MSLRSRLAWAFALVVLAPLLTVAVIVARAIPQQADARLSARLSAVRDATVVALGQDCETAHLLAAQLAVTPTAVPTQRLRTAVAGRIVDVAAVLSASGAVRSLVVSHDTVPARVRPLLSAPDCRLAPQAPLLVARVVLHTTDGRPAGSIVTGVLLTSARLRSLAPAGFDISVGNRAVAASTRGEAGRDDLQQTARPALRRLGNRLAAVSPVAGRSGALVAISSSRSSSRPAALLLLAGVALAVALASSVGWLLARLTTRPITQLREAAQRVAAGDLDTEIPASTDDEVGDLAEALAVMTDGRREGLEELARSRDELRRSLARLGDTLSGTHDLWRILNVILETAMVSVGAQAGAVLLTSPRTRDAYVEVARGLDGRIPGSSRPGSSTRIPLGAGVTGRVAETGLPAHGVVGRGPGELVLSALEPSARTLISVPLRSDRKVTGVLNLYDTADGRAFTSDDLDVVRSFAVQASVAIDNVMLHREAERLSLTDGLTGLANYRHLTTALAREIERASRFHRPLGVLMLDLDRFKQVNDTYGHQRGDAVLMEVARRVGEVIREVDVLARYGGEELVVLLPETDVDGAEQLAERIGAAMREVPFGGPGEAQLTVTVSVGVAVMPLHGADPKALIKAADDALYVAKREGRDCWRLAGARSPLPAAGESRR